MSAKSVEELKFEIAGVRAGMVMRPSNQPELDVVIQRKLVDLQDELIQAIDLRHEDLRQADSFRPPALPIQCGDLFSKARSMAYERVRQEELERMVVKEVARLRSRHTWKQRLRNLFPFTITRRKA